jgi:SAM-dependent methyltransferase
VSTGHALRWAGLSVLLATLALVLKRSWRPTWFSDHVLPALWRLTIARTADQRLGAWLRASARPGARVLDLGCGDGTNLQRFLNDDLPFGSYLGLDVDESTLTAARARFVGIPSATFCPNDLADQPLPDGRFDLILAIWSLERMPDPYSVVARAAQRLRHGGRAILLVVSPVHDHRALVVKRVASLAGRRLQLPAIYGGLPNAIAVECFADGLINLVVLERKAASGLDIHKTRPEAILLPAHFLARNLPTKTGQPQRMNSPHP